MRMEEGLDTGAYCVCRTTRIEGKGAEELSDELAVLGSHALLTALVHVENGAAEWTEQDEGQVTYASKLEKGELDLDPADPAAVLARKVQASSAAHPARCVLAGRGVTVLSGQEAESDGPAAGLTEGLAPARRGFRGSACCSAAPRALTKCGTSSPTASRPWMPALSPPARRPCAKAMRFGRRDMPDQNTDHRSDRPDHGRGGRPGAPLGGGRREGGPQPTATAGRKATATAGRSRPRPQAQRRPPAPRRRAASSPGRQPPRGGERRGGRTFSDGDGLQAARRP